MSKQPSPIEEIIDIKDDGIIMIGHPKADEVLEFAERLFEAGKRQRAVCYIYRTQLDYLYAAFEDQKRKIAKLTQDNQQLMAQISAKAEQPKPLAVQVGDECFLPTFGICYVVSVDRMYVSCSTGSGGEMIHIKRDYKFHPTLFNSFAQFLAYWQEEALKLKGGE